MFFLGVDAGGTSTTFLLGDEHKELAQVQVGSLKRMRVGAEQAEQHLVQALSELERLTGVQGVQIARCCIGASGDNVELVSNWLRDAFGRHTGGEISIVNDTVIALDAAFPGMRGVIAIAGTGSNVAGRTADGTPVNCGGWGPALASQGSGHWIGCFGLRRGFFARDQQRPTRLLDCALAHWNLDSINDLVAYANQQPQPDFSTLAPVFAECASAGDQVAQELLRDAGRELADVCALAIERVMRLEADPDNALPPVATIGSVINSVAAERDAFCAALRVRFPQIEFAASPATPAAGALWRARNKTN